MSSTRTFASPTARDPRLNSMVARLQLATGTGDVGNSFEHARL